MSDTPANQTQEIQARYGLPKEQAKQFVTVKRILECKIGIAVQNLENYLTKFTNPDLVGPDGITMHDLHTANRTLAVMVAIMQRDEHCDAGHQAQAELLKMRLEAERELQSNQWKMKMDRIDDNRPTELLAVTSVTMKVVGPRRTQFAEPEPN